MGWQLKSTPKTYRVTLKLAKEWSEMEAAHTDRPLSERRLTVYREMVKNKQFRPVTWAKAFCKETGQYYRVNGKHTSTLFSSMPDVGAAELFVVIEDYEADTLQDVANLYSTFDSKVQSRNTTDVNRAFAAIIPEFCQREQGLINTLVSALAYYENPSVDNQNSGKTVTERAELLFDNVDFGTWFFETIMENGRKPKNAHIFRAPVIAAIKGCWLKAKKDAEEFWLAVRDETGTSPDCPDRKLAKFLMMHNSRRGGGRSGVPLRHRIVAREFFCKAIRGWNAWRAKEKTSLAYSPEDKIPAIK